MAGRDGIASSRALRVGLTAATVVSAAILVALATFVGMAATDAFPRWTGTVVLAFSTLWLGVIGLVVIHSGHPKLAVLRRPRLQRIGAISYGLYLYHFLVIVISGDIYRSIGLRGQPLWREAPTIGVCFAIAALSWKYIERPILGLKNRFVYEDERPRALSSPSTASGERVGAI